MSAGKYTMSLTATAQALMLSPSERAAITKFFSNGGDGTAVNTRASASGGFISRVGKKRVLWRKAADQPPEVEMIVDESYAGIKAQHRAVG